MQPKHERCIACKYSDFADGKQLDEQSGDPIGKCCYNPPAVVVLHFQEPLIDVPGRQNVPGTIHEVVTGAQPVVKASFWCRVWERQT